MKSVCVTGHRPAKLPWGYETDGTEYNKYRKTLKKCIKQYIKLGYLNFISGMALGVNMDFAELVIDLKDKYKITLECAIPCPDQTKMWSQQQIKRYENIIAHADKVTLVNNHYFSSCMFVRNRYMVDCSDIVLAVWNGEENGGTWQTIKYAIVKIKKLILFVQIEKKDLRKASPRCDFN